MVPVLLSITPLTSNAEEGLAVPIPTLPDDATVKKVLAKSFPVILNVPAPV